MNAIVKQMGLSPLMMPLHKARSVVMKEPRVVTLGDDENDTVSLLLSSSTTTPRSSLSRKKNISSRRQACHVVLKAFRDYNIVDPYDYDEDTDDTDDDDDDSNSSLMMDDEEEDTSCSSSESCLSDDEESSSLLLSPNDDDHHHHQNTNTNIRKVRFGTPLVTAIYVRPITTIEEKSILYYNERNYREFRRNYIWYTRSLVSKQQQQNQQQQLIVDRPRRTETNSTTTASTTTTTTKRTSVVQFHVDVVSEIHTKSIMDDYNPSELYYSRVELQGFLDDFVASLAKGGVV